MFEKEAEEYLKKDGTKAEQILSFMQEKIKVTIKQIPFILAAFQQTFIDGAEFGYNKAKEEMQKQGLALQSDMDKTIEQNIALKKQIEKMKCCYNCRHSRTECEHCKTDKHEKWEIKE